MARGRGRAWACCRGHGSHARPGAGGTRDGGATSIGGRRRRRSCRSPRSIRVVGEKIAFSPNHHRGVPALEVHYSCALRSAAPHIMRSASRLASLSERSRGKGARPGHIAWAFRPLGAQAGSSARLGLDSCHTYAQGVALGVAQRALSWEGRSPRAYSLGLSATRCAGGFLRSVGSRFTGGV